MWLLYVVLLAGFGECWGQFGSLGKLGEGVNGLTGGVKNLTLGGVDSAKVGVGAVTGAAVWAGANTADILVRTGNKSMVLGTEVVGNDLFITLKDTVVGVAMMPIRVTREMLDIAKKYFPNVDMITMQSILPEIKLNETQIYLTYSSVVHPMQLAEIGIRFYLYTREDRTNFTEVLAFSNETIESGVLNSTKQTKFIVHGYLNTGAEPWMIEIKNRLLDHGDFNVILVDWGQGANTLYPWARANTKIVGTQIARLINFLTAYHGFKSSHFHLTGHSLGAHICGYAGSRIAKLGRITGLDPAGPLFKLSGVRERLDNTDAIFVDNIHTNNGWFADLDLLNIGFGLSKPVGDMDFLPNSGAFQPGCEFDEVGLDIGCSHSRAHALFMDSINATCPYMGHVCNSYDDYLHGLCKKCVQGSSSCATMGYHSARFFKPILSEYPPANKVYYLTTRDKESYCVYHYHLRLVVSSFSDDIPLASLTLNFNGDFYTAVNVSVPNSEYTELKSNMAYDFLAQVDKPLGSVPSLDIKWVAQGLLSGLRSTQKLILQNVFLQPIDQPDDGWTSLKQYQQMDTEAPLNASEFRTFYRV